MSPSLCSTSPPISTRGNLSIAAAMVFTGDIAISIPHGSRRLPLDGIKHARRNSRFHSDSLEAMPPAVIGGDAGVRYDGARELGEPVLEPLQRPEDVA
jgi:hypothetical protein